MEFTLLYSVLTAVATMWLAVRFATRAGHLDGIPHPVDTMIGAASMGLFAGRITAMIIDGINPIINPFQILLVRAGVNTEVAAITAVGVIVWVSRAHLPGWIDRLTPAAIAGLAGWHGGCVWRGTCLGSVSDVPWAYPLSGSAITRHPVELYAAIGLIFASLVIARSPGRPWLATGTGIALAALTRLLTEPLRPSLSGGPVTFYAVAIVVGTALAIFGSQLRRRKEVLGSP